MKILTESILPFTCRGWSVRVWREEPSGDLSDYEEIYNAIKELSDRPKVTRKEIASRLTECERVNAVEVKSGLGLGIVDYVDWP